MQETNSTSCSHSTAQVTNGAWINRGKTLMTCGVRNCRAVLNAGGAHTVLTNNSLNQTRPRFLLGDSQTQVALIYCEARIRARRLAQKGWHVANKLAYGQANALCSSTNELLGNQTTFSWACVSKL